MKRDLCSEIDELPNRGWFSTLDSAGSNLGEDRRMLGESDAEDAAQDVFLRVTRALPEFREEHQFRPWIFQITVNRARDLIRRRRRAKPVLPPPVSQPVITAREDRERLFSAIRLLPADQSETLLLVYQEQMSHNEAASVLDISREAIKMRVYRGLQQLRGLLRREES